MAMRSVIILLGILVFAASTGAKAGDPIAVKSNKIFLDTRDASIDRVGALIYRGGLELTSDAEGFGGFSAILVSANGARLTALTDRGRLILMRLAYDDSGNLTGVGEASLSLLPGLETRTQSEWRDSEGLTTDTEGGLLVSFEQRHRIWRYASPDAEPTEIPAPEEIHQTVRNQGMEALARLGDGRLIVISEGLYKGDGVIGWIGNADGGEWESFIYVTSQGYKPTDVATLPDGDILVVERRFPLISIRLRRLQAEDLAVGGNVEAKEIARIEGSLSVDNFEGIASRRGAEGETLVYLMSDDNFNALQRTLLLMFELEE